MTWPLVLLVCVVGVLAAAATEIVLMRFRTGWSARRRVFAAASAGPILIISPLVLIVVAMAFAPDDPNSAVAAATVLTLGITIGLASFIAGLLTAFMIERLFQS